MCGICGVIQISGAPRRVVAPDVLDRMTDVMTHRGPNDRGTFVAPGAAVGVRRLSIVDVDGGHQPFSNEDGTIWAAQNGELYNHDELRSALRADGHAFTSRCDTEILPHLYERHGSLFPELLRGKFGIVLWDGKRRRAVIARDRLGVKPLYYARSGDLLVFASELKSLLQSGLVEPKLDYDAIDAYLVLGYVPAPATPLLGVSKLLPGHRLVVEDGDVTVEPYWRHPLPAATEHLSVDEHAERLIAELDEAVRLRLMSDVPVGAMLSGGLDSSLIVALMARHMNRPVKTFSVGFKEAGAENELGDARFVASALGADHHELELSISEQVVDLDELVWSLDEPIADLSSLGFLALSQLAAQHVTVALSGQGADELLGGYPKHVAARLVGSWQRVPWPVRQLGNSLLRLAPERYERAAGALAARGPVERLLVMSGQLNHDLRRELVRGPLAAVDGSAAARAIGAFLGDARDEPLPTTLYLDAQLGLVDDMLHYFDRTSMAHSLEVRVPFLDHHVVEHCATIPASLKVHGLTTKYLLKHASRGLVPDRIIDKRKIGFFSVVVDMWLQQQTDGAIAERLLGGSPGYASFLDRGAVERLVALRASGSKRREVRLVLAILMLEIWLSTYLPRAVAPPSPERDRIELAA